MDYKDLLSLAAQVAHYMDGVWRVDRRPIDQEQQYLGVCLLSAGNRIIRIQDAQRLRKKGMLYIRGECPNFGLSHQEQRNAGLPLYHKGIYVSQHRPAKQIAADIDRRLMPRYMELLSKAVETSIIYRRNRDHLDYIEQGFKKLVPHLRPYSDNHYSTSRRFSFAIPNSEYRSGDLEISSYKGKRCDLNLPDISIETAMRIMALLQEEQERE